MKNKKIEKLKKKLETLGHDLSFVEANGVLCMIVDFDQKKIFSKDGKFTTTQFLADASNSLSVPIMKYYEG